MKHNIDAQYSTAVQTLFENSVNTKRYYQDIGVDQQTTFTVAKLSVDRFTIIEVSKTTNRDDNQKLNYISITIKGKTCIEFERYSSKS